MSSFELVLPFDTDSEDFVRGFEAGRIWTLMTENPAMLPGLIFHANNAEMVIRMIEKKGLPLKAQFTDDQIWMRLEETTERMI
jgi:hypothetical protein